VVWTVPPAALPIATTIIGLTFISIAWWTNAAAIATGRTLVQAFKPEDTQLKNLDYFKQAIAYNSYGTPDVRIELARVALAMAEYQGIPDVIKEQFFSAANDELQLQSEASLDPRFDLLHGILLDAYGDYLNAQQALLRAHQLAPRNQTILFEMTGNAQARGDRIDELIYAKQAYDLDRSNTQAAMFYSDVLRGNEIPLDVLNSIATY
jgi:tetratricopeptide (TPR) repeat protein